MGAISLLVVFVLSVVGFRFIAGYDWLESVWMVVITISTVGFSEGSQSTPAVQAFTVAVILLGVTSAAYTFGGFIQLLLVGEFDRIMGSRKMAKEISRLREHVIVCGFGQLGQDLVHQLRHRAIPYVVIDLDIKKIELATIENGFAIQGDATADTVLNQAQLKSARALVTALPTDAENVFITLTARNLRPDIQIIAKSDQESSCQKLRQAGANKIVMPDRVGAHQMERMISRPTTADLIELFAEASQLEIELDEFYVSAGNPLVDATLAETAINLKFDLLIIGIKNSQGEFQFNPSPAFRIQAGDTLLVIGNVDNINRMKSTLQI